jgi:hypothetical protein
MQNSDRPCLDSHAPFPTIFHSLSVQNTVISLTYTIFMGKNACTFASFLRSFHHSYHTILTLLYGQVKETKMHTFTARASKAQIIKLRQPVYATYLESYTSTKRRQLCERNCACMSQIIYIKISNSMMYGG